MAEAQMEAILAAGDDKLGVIDANDNGVINEDDDCVVHASTDGGGGLLITGRQNSDAPDRMRLCTNQNDLAENEGHCFGSGMGGPDSAEASLEDCEFAGGPFVPMLAQFCSSLSSCLSAQTATGAAGRAAGAAPPHLTAGAVFQTLFVTPFRSGSGQLCNAGGPAVQITGDDNVTVLRELVPFPDASNPTHMCVHNVPVQLTFGGKVLRTVCFPVRNNAVDLALETDSENPFAIIDLTGLPGCGGRTAAPTMSEWGLILLLGTLLAVGTWGLGRRRGFYQSLPLP
jgi:hypothetical protein